MHERSMLRLCERQSDRGYGYAKASTRDAAVSIRRHTFYNLAGAVLPMGLSLVTIPIYIRLVGESRYGVLAVAWLLLGYFGLFDLGLGRATAQRIAAQAQAGPTERAETFWTALAMNSALGVLGGLIIWPAALFFFGHVFSIEATLRPELDTAIPWMILAVPLATISGVLSGALQGRAQFFELNIISVFSAVLIQIVPLLVAWLHGPDLAWLLPATILARLFTMGLLALRCRAHVLVGQPRSVSRALARELLQFGGWVTVTSLVGPMMVILDRFVIGALMGARFVTFYTVPFQLGSRANVIPGALSSALFPRMAEVDQAEGQRLALRALRTLAVVMTPAMLFGIFFMQPFLSIWLSPAFAGHAALVGEILLLGFWVNAFATVPYALLQASGRPHLVAQCHLIEVLPYFGALYLGLHFFGLAGAAVAFGLRTGVDNLLLLYFAGLLRQGFAVLAFPALLMAAGLAGANLWRTGAPLWWAAGSLLCLCALVWAWRTVPAELRFLLTSGFRRWVAHKPSISAK